MSEIKFSSMLQPGESVATIDAPAHGSQEWAFGYTYGEIQANKNKTGNSVVLEVEPGGAVEPVLITHDIVLTVQAVQGKGLAIIYNVEKDDEVKVIEMDIKTEPIALVRGDAYYYLNNGEGNLVLRDDCTPAFQGNEETQLTKKSENSAIDGRTVELPVAFWQAFKLTR